ncbi:MAG: hypothetical protein ACFFDY_00520 [Candidatus Thorarchaeota archaeon]
MAIKELYDYLPTVSADVDQTLSINPQSVLTEIITKNDQVQEGDDRSEERAEFTGDFIAYIVIRYDILDDEDSGTTIDFFYNSSKGNGLINSFKFAHPDNHTYVVRFDTDMTRLMNPTNYSNKNIRLKVLGRIAD